MAGYETSTKLDELLRDGLVEDFLNGKRDDDAVLAAKEGVDLAEALLRRRPAAEALSSLRFDGIAEAKP